MSKEGTFVIGRDSSADIVIGDDTVGRRHAEIVVTDGKFFLTDLDSSNGVYQILEDGSEIPFGRGWVAASDRFAFGRVESTIAALLAGLSQSRLEALGIHDRIMAIAGSISVKPEEKTGRRIRCMACGAVYLASESACPKCSEPRKSEA